MELRKDYILDRYVIIAEQRTLRPDSFRRDGVIHPNNLSDNQIACHFCAGNEYLTPKEKGRFGNPWIIRWFENKFPIVEPLGKYFIQTDNKYFTFSDAYGYHEVIAETNDHNKQLYDFNEVEIKNLLTVYKNRMQELYSKDHIQYVHLFKNHGKDAGTSVKHSHSQILALAHIPRLVREELTVVNTYQTCPHCEILNIENASYRRCFENNTFVAFTPYASRFNYEIWIFPKKHYASLTEISDDALLDLASIMKRVLSRLKDLNCSYNYYLHCTPKGYMNNPAAKTLHFHIEITPRIQLWGGVEHGSETIVNQVSPETAARFYRGEQ
jgi:UDPglucose--hexose-1-phosphate uridylyltransferase